MPTKKNKTDDWRELASGSSEKKGRPMPWSVRLRRMWIWTRRIFAVALVAALCVGAWYVWQNTYFEDFFNGGSERIKRVEYKTDGVIGARWMTSYLKIPKKSKLSDVNIFGMKSSIEALTQVRDASVERILPDTLRIIISELKPMMKLKVRVDFTDRIYLMSPDGIFFEPVCMNDEFVEKLPSIEGLDLKFDGKVPDKYVSAPLVAEFLAYAQAKLGDAISEWVSINVHDLNSVTLPLIRVKTNSSTIIVFSTKDFQKQFDRLEYILRYSKEKGLKGIEKIDLSLRDRADVRYIDSPKNERK